MSELPESETDMIDTLKKGLAQEVPELDWLVYEGAIYYRAEGYKHTGIRRWFERSKIRIMVPFDEKELGIWVNDPGYINHGERIKYSAEKGLFGPLQEVFLTRKYKPSRARQAP